MYGYKKLSESPAAHTHTHTHTATAKHIIKLLTTSNKEKNFKAVTYQKRITLQRKINKNTFG